MQLRVPSYTKQRLDEAYTLFKNKNFSAAMEIFEEIIKRSNFFDQVITADNIGLARCYLKDKKPRKALEVLYPLLNKDDPLKVKCDVCITISKCYIELYTFESNEEFLKKANDILGLIREDQLDPRSYRNYRFAYIDLLRKAKLFSQSAEELRILAEKFPTDVDIKITLYDVYGHLKETNRSVVLSQELADRIFSPGTKDSLTGNQFIHILNVLILHTTDFDELSKRIEAMDIKDNSTLLLYASRLSNIQRYKEANKLFDELLARYANEKSNRHWQARISYAVSLLQQEYYQEVFEAVRPILANIKLDSEKGGPTPMQLAEVYNNKARAFYGLGKKKAEAECIRKGLFYAKQYRPVTTTKAKMKRDPKNKREIFEEGRKGHPFLWQTLHGPYEFETHNLFSNLFLQNSEELADFVEEPVAYKEEKKATKPTVDKKIKIQDKMVLDEPQLESTTANHPSIGKAIDKDKDSKDSAHTKLINNKTRPKFTKNASNLSTLAKQNTNKKNPMSLHATFGFFNNRSSVANKNTRKSHKQLAKKQKNNNENSLCLQFGIFTSIMTTVVGAVVAYNMISQP